MFVPPKFGSLMPSALDSGKRSPQKQLAALVRLAYPSRQTYGLEQKGDGPVPPSEPEPSRAAAPPLAFDKALRMNVYLLTRGRNFQTAGSGTPASRDRATAR